MTKRLFLIDGSAVMYRSHFAFIKNPLRNSRGEITSAAFGFVNMLISLIEKESPTHLAVVFDTPEPTFRHATFPEYKATRQKMPVELVEQIGRLNQLLEAMGLAVISRPGWEADDVIGTIAPRAEQEGFEVFIVTGDKDFQQLVTDHVRIWNPKDQGGVVVGPSEVLENFGVPPKQVVDVLALMGDSSDNVPGVEGIGHKTAVKLITEYGSLEGVLEAAPAMKTSRTRDLLIRDRDRALLSRNLVTIDRQAPVEFTPSEWELKPILNAETERLLIELELFKLLEKLRSHYGNSPRTEHDRDSRPGYRSISDVEELLELVGNWIHARPLLSMNLETSSRDAMQAELVGASFSVCEGEAYYIPIDQLAGKAPAPREFSRFGKTVTGGCATFLNALAPVYENQNIPKTGQNLKHDCLVLKTYGVEVEGIQFDTILAAYLLNPGDRALNPDTLAREYLKLNKMTDQDLQGAGSDQMSMREVDVERMCDYACEEADFALRLTHVLSPLIQEHRQETILRDIEIPLIPVLRDVEYSGIRLDTELLKEMSRELDRDLTRIEETCYRVAGGPFNLNSPKQLAAVLFERLKLPVQRKTKTGPSTDVDTLQALAPLHELPQKLLEYRTLAKLKSTYVDNLPALVHPQTGRLHTTFSQTVAATGRLSSSNPNLQNIPIRTEIGRRIREAFVPGFAGWKIVSADYSQIELRIMAHLSGDERLLDAFRRGGDIHTETAALIFGVETSAVQPDMRRAAKTVNFGIIYGQTDFGLAQELGIPRHEARAFRENYFRLYPGVAEFMKQTVENCRETGYAQTILGRRRLIPDISASDRQVREFAERTAINTPVQGSAADMIKLAMIAIHRRLKQEGLEARMILQVHDELVFEAPESEVERLTDLAREEMKQALPLRVPVLVEVGVGANWLAAH